MITANRTGQRLASWVAPRAWIFQSMFSAPRRQIAERKSGVVSPPPKKNHLTGGPIGVRTISHAVPSR